MSAPPTTRPSPLGGRILLSPAQGQQSGHILELVERKTLYPRSSLKPARPQTELSQVLKFQPGEVRLFLLALTFFFF